MAKYTAGEREFEKEQVRLTDVSTGLGALTDLVGGGGDKPRKRKRRKAIAPREPRAKGGTPRERKRF